MRRFQIVEGQGGECQAGPKAVHDASRIASGMGFASFRVSRLASENTLVRQMGRLLWLAKMPYYLLRYPRNGVLFFQFPQLSLSGKLGCLLVNSSVIRRRNLKVIVLIHDIEAERTEKGQEGGPLGALLDDIVEVADVMIVHNAAMREWFVQHGVDANRLVTLGIFDYLASGERSSPADGGMMSVAFAGNLLTRKCRFLSDLSSIAGVSWRLYGPNFDAENVRGENVEYRGCLQPDDAPNAIDGGWGLVWDGDSVDSCVGEFGDYLRYNDPHKLSLYLAAGMPVIIWDEAAEAEFVLREKVGIAVGSLREVPGRIRAIEPSAYAEMKANARRMETLLREGHYLKTAIGEAVLRVSRTESKARASGR